jgi:DNA-directed RNA polymerase specialized sigma24 family protein
MFGSLYVLGAKLTDIQIQDFLRDYYAYSYAVAENFRTPYLGDDEKENVAYQALQRALRTFDTARGMKFSNYLHLVIVNDLRSAVEKAKRRPISVTEVSDNEGESKDIFEFIEDYKSSKDVDQNMYNLLTTELEKHLTDPQKQIIDMLMSPEVYVSKYNNEFKSKKPAKKLNYDVMAAFLGVSIATISFEMKKIRNVLEKVVKDIDLYGKLKSKFVK